MKGVQITGVDQLSVADLAAAPVGRGEVEVTIRAAALNHRDVWIKRGQYAGIKYPCRPGSDGAGVVTAVGEGAAGFPIGSEVIINPSFDWGTSEAAQSPAFSILGLPRDGTLAEKVVVPVTQLAPKPAHLEWTEAAALPLAGLTAFRALFGRARLQKGERVLISGVGGGVALFALQFAVAHGAQVWVTSGSAEKIARAVELGAKGGFDYRVEGWAKSAVKLAGFFDVVIESAGGRGFDAVLDATAPGGRIAVFGATTGNPPELALRKIFWRQISVLGTTMGGPVDWRELLAFVDLHKPRPVVSATYPLAEAAEAFALMERGGQFGKIVVVP